MVCTKWGSSNTIPPIDRHSSRQAQPRVDDPAFKRRMMLAIRFSGEVEEVDSQECDDETTKQGEGVRAIGGIKSLEKNQGGHDRRTRESNIVHWVYAVHWVSDW